eukprot:snap_masked-scaffold_24-processed-gene-5.5-mRNA-1 protein AED:1.00 eAED:1.00 QI:0/0/0/0/1/1/2/0/940
MESELFNSFSRIVNALESNNFTSLFSEMNKFSRIINNKEDIQVGKHLCKHFLTRLLQKLFITGSTQINNIKESTSLQNFILSFLMVGKDYEIWKCKESEIKERVQLFWRIELMLFSNKDNLNHFCFFSSHLKIIQELLFETKRNKHIKFVLNDQIDKTNNKIFSTYSLSIIGNLIQLSKKSFSLNLSTRKLREFQYNILNQIYEGMKIVEESFYEKFIPSLFSVLNIFLQKYKDERLVPVTKILKDCSIIFYNNSNTKFKENNVDNIEYVLKTCLEANEREICRISLFDLSSSLLLKCLPKLLSRKKKQDTDTKFSFEKTFSFSILKSYSSILNYIFFSIFSLAENPNEINLSISIDIQKQIYSSVKLAIQNVNSIINLTNKKLVFLYIKNTLMLDNFTFSEDEDVFEYLDILLKTTNTEKNIEAVSLKSNTKNQILNEIIYTISRKDKEFVKLLLNEISKQWIRREKTYLNYLYCLQETLDKKNNLSLLEFNKTLSTLVEISSSEENLSLIYSCVGVLFKSFSCVKDSEQYLRLKVPEAMVILQDISNSNYKYALEKISISCGFLSIEELVSENLSLIIDEATNKLLFVSAMEENISLVVSLGSIFKRITFIENETDLIYVKLDPIFPRLKYLIQEFILLLNSDNFSDTKSVFFQSISSTIYFCIRNIEKYLRIKIKEKKNRKKDKDYSFVAFISYLKLIRQQQQGEILEEEKDEEITLERMNSDLKEILRKISLSVSHFMFAENIFLRRTITNLLISCFNCISLLKSETEKNTVHLIWKRLIFSCKTEKNVVSLSEKLIFLTRIIQNVGDFISERVENDLIPLIYHLLRIAKSINEKEKQENNFFRKKSVDIQIKSYQLINSPQQGLKLALSILKLLILCLDEFETFKYYCKKIYIETAVFEKKPFSMFSDVQNSLKVLRQKITQVNPQSVCFVKKIT